MFKQAKEHYQSQGVDLTCMTEIEVAQYEKTMRSALKADTIALYCSVVLCALIYLRLMTTVATTPEAIPVLALFTVLCVMCGACWIAMRGLVISAKKELASLAMLRDMDPAATNHMFTVTTICPESEAYRVHALRLRGQLRKFDADRVHALYDQQRQKDDLAKMELSYNALHALPTH